MKYNIKICNYSCTTMEFTINNVDADEDDFGYKEDLDKDTAELYGCGNRRFIPIEPTQEVLNKYKITEPEYEEICEILEDKLSFGHCCLCI